MSGSRFASLTGPTESVLGDLLAMPVSQREQFCLNLLEDLGADNISVRGDEILHSCILPFGLHAHGDRHPSASLNSAKMVMVCRVCGGGGLLWFLANVRGGESTEARQWLGAKAGLTDTAESLDSLLAFLDALEDERAGVPILIPHFSPAILRPWEMVHPWLTEHRHVPEENVVGLRIGYDSESCRIVIPHWWRGELVGWQTRRLLDDGTPKYRSTPDFPKGETLYAENSDRDPVVVVESPMSVIRHHHHQPLVATFGAQVTDAQVRLLAEHRCVTIVPDPDHAGWESTLRMVEALNDWTVVRVAEHDWAADAADFDEATLDRIVAEAVPGELWRPPTCLRAWPAESG